MSPDFFTRYGEEWPPGTTDLQVELAMIRLGGRSPRFPEALPLFDHFMLARKLCWPNRYRHRWVDLLYSEFLRNDISVMMGAASTGKTSTACEFILLNYFARPEITLVVLSTITVDKLETGVFGEVKMLFRMARERHPWLPGNVIEGKRCIATDSVDKDSGAIRDLRRGIIGRACWIGGRYVGLGALAGTKQEYVFYLADECQFMAEAFIAQWANLFSNGNVKIIASGNPKHDPYDQLGLAAEPKNGWPSVGVPDRTSCWDTKFLNGRCINLVGTDSPNFDVPEGQPVPFPKLITWRFAKRIANDYGPESPQFHTQVKGVMRLDFAHERVITRELCRQHKALESAVWLNDERTRILGIDPSYGGDDRCVGTVVEVGDDMQGVQILRFVTVEICRLRLDLPQEVEHQIATWARSLADGYSIPHNNIFYDSVGKGTLGFYFAKVFGSLQPIPVDSGAEPTERPVRENLYVADQKTGLHRLKTCREHYYKFVSELWFSVRYAIMANQIRELPEPTMLEGCARIYENTKGNKIAVEPKSDPKKKEDLRRRLGKSPDLFDSAVIAVEGARQRGFGIASLGSVSDGQDDDADEINQEARDYDAAIKKRMLDHKV